MESALHLLSSQTWATNVLICATDFLTMALFACFCFEYRMILSSLCYLHLKRFSVNTCSDFYIATFIRKPILNDQPNCWLFHEIYKVCIQNIRKQRQHNCCTYLSETKFVADTTTSSVFCTMTGILRQPGDFRILAKSFMVSWSTLGGHMSIFVTTTNTGTLSASASPRCSEGKWVHTNKQQKRFRRPAINSNTNGNKKIVTYHTTILWGFQGAHIVSALETSKSGLEPVARVSEL